MADFIRGDTKDLAFKIKQEDTYITLDDCTEIEVQINSDSDSGKNITKTLSGGDITFDEGTNTFHVLLSQLDTFKCPVGINNFQVRVVRSNGVKATTTAQLMVGMSLSNKYLSLSHLEKASIEEVEETVDQTAEIEVLKAKIAKLISDNEKKVAELEKDKEDALTKLKYESDDKLATLERNKNSEIDNLKKANDNKLFKLTKDTVEEIAKIRKSKEEEIDILQKRKDAELALLQQSKDDAIAALTKSKLEEISRLQRSHLEELAKIKKEKNDISDRLRELKKAATKDTEEGE